MSLLTTLERKQAFLSWKKFDFMIDDLKITLILQEGRFLHILFLMRVLKSSDTVPRKGKTITKSFFWEGNVTMCQWVIYWKSFLMQLWIILKGNAFFFNISFKWRTSEWNLEKSEPIEKVRNNKVKIIFLKLYVLWKWNCEILNMLH